MTSLVALAAACAAPTSEAPTSAEEDPGAEQASESALTAQSVPNRSGTRLRARYARGSDGSQYLIGWFDTKLKAPCEVVSGAFGSMGLRLEPGTRYACRPGYPSLDVYSTWPVYADAACTQQIVLSVSAVPPRAYARDGKLFDLTKSSAAQPSTAFLRDASGACVSVPVASDTRLSVYDAKEVSDSEFVTFVADP